VSRNDLPERANAELVTTLNGVRWVRESLNTTKEIDKVIFVGKDIPVVLFAKFFQPRHSAITVWYRNSTKVCEQCELFCFADDSIHRFVLSLKVHSGNKSAGFSRKKNLALSAYTIHAKHILSILPFPHFVF